MPSARNDSAALSARIREFVERYYALSAALTASRRPAAVAARSTRLAHDIAVGQVPRAVDGPHTFHFAHYLQRAISDEGMHEKVDLAWFTLAVMEIGDQLAAHRYFDRSPELELLRHIRNGLAHGNVFRVDDSVDLHKFPADNLRAANAAGAKKVFSITRSLTGKPVLFDFMAPGDLLDLMTWIANHLEGKGH